MQVWCIGQPRARLTATFYGDLYDFTAELITLVTCEVILPQHVLHLPSA
jgi:hypothetical protein